jgi:molybdopterin/thiamine biosynthesis adenylyltransferase
MRQIPLIGDEGQEKLLSARVIIAGAGGLGSAIATYLAAAGVGFIRIVDEDIVEDTCLSCQPHYYEQEIGTCRAFAIKRAIHAFAPGTEVDTVNSPIDLTAVGGFVSGMDLILDGLDNFQDRYTINRAGIDEKIPFIHGAVHGFYGQVTTIVPGVTPCLRCIVPVPPEWKSNPVIGVTCGTIGCIEATEAIKYLTGVGEILKNRLLFWDGLRGDAEIIQVVGSPGCPDCGTSSNETAIR